MVSDWLTNVFLFTFLFGLLFTVVSLVLGVTHVGGLDSGHNVHVHVGHGDTHIGHAGHAAHDGHGGAEAEGPGMLNMPTIMAFLTWFGGAGYIFSRTFGWGGFFTVPLALASGFAGASIMFTLLARLLWPMMSKPMNSADYELPGTPARVVSFIREGGVGEIVYTRGGSRFTAGARCVDERPVAKGAEVVIIKYERGMAYVQPVQDILGQRGGEANPA